MKTLFLLLACLTPVLCLAQDNVEVTWQNPDHYRDIRPANESPRRFRERLFRNLVDHLRALARKLPQGQRLEITFTDIDLAGEVRMGARGDVRIVRDTQPAVLTFHWRLLDEGGRPIRQGEERLRGDNATARALSLSHSDPFPVEKALLRRWFSDRIVR